MRKRQENKLVRNLVTLFIVLLMVGSVIGYMFGRGSGESFKYNDYKFLKRGNKFVLKFDREELEFDYFPSDVENINISSEVFAKFSNKIEIDSTYDNNTKWKAGISVSQFDLERFFSVIGIYFVKGLTTENEFEMPVITCEDATSKVPVIYFKESNETKVFAEDHCVIAEAKSELDFIRIKDRLIYGLLKVIENE
ncbi:hypothetical protein KY342_05245 [Candidatus Woesearchaeota archaeon]|nr:hypothetical protein [Candidatus Woesearchaeota archaeon]